MKIYIIIAVFISVVVFNGCSDVNSPASGQCKIVIEFGALGARNYAVYEGATSTNRGSLIAEDGGVLFGQVIFTLPSGTSYGIWNDLHSGDILMRGLPYQTLVEAVECRSGDKETVRDYF